MILKPDQVKAYDKLSKLKCGALFMEAGTGKTKTAIELVRSKLDKIDKVLWAAPASLLKTKNYHNELEKSCDFLEKFEFYTLEGIGSSNKIYLKACELCDKNKVFMVVDESLLIKNASAKRTRRCFDLRDKTCFRLILNGTPISKSLCDMWSQMEFLSPKILKMTERQFAYSYLKYEIDPKIRCSWRIRSTSMNEKAFIEIIRPYVFDSKLDIDVDLVKREVECELSYKEKEDYDSFKANLEVNLLAKAEANGFDEPWFLGLCASLQNRYSTCESRLAACRSEVNSFDGKTIIYCKYLSEIDLLKAMFLDSCIIFTGSEKGSLEDFENDTSKKILLCTYGCGSLGLNLQFASKIIFFSSTFDYKYIDQAIHRIYRLGQESTCEIVSLYTDTGLDKIMMECLTKKDSSLKFIKTLLGKNPIKNL